MSVKVVVLVGVDVALVLVPVVQLLKHCQVLNKDLSELFGLLSILLELVFGTRVYYCR